MNAFIFSFIFLYSSFSVSNCKDLFEANSASSYLIWPINTLALKCHALGLLLSMLSTVIAQLDASLVLFKAKYISVIKHQQLKSLLSIAMAFFM